MELGDESIPTTSPHFKFGFLNLSDAPIFSMLQGISVATDHEIG